MNRAQRHIIPIAYRTPVPIEQELINRIPEAARRRVDNKSVEIHYRKEVSIVQGAALHGKGVMHTSRRICLNPIQMQNCILHRTMDPANSLPRGHMHMRRSGVAHLRRRLYKSMIVTIVRLQDPRNHDCHKRQSPCA
ncbi:hypothetical protein HUJ05_002120 [Dendroctonus ponderosae]|nr:hypothetical protein HUJ05_002120 [Dendroctonus ponderosae]